MSKPVILVLGFYNRSNLGDEMFKEVIPKVFPDFTCVFENTDDFSFENLTSYHGIVVGPGDVVNDYFLANLSKKLKNYSGPIYGVGIGVSHENEIRKHYDFFDHVFLRETADLDLWSRLIGAKYVHYLPDLGFLKFSPRHHHRKSDIRKIGVFLAQPMVNQPGYLDKAVHLIRSCRGSEIILYSFNTFDNPKENDLLIAESVKQLIPCVRVDQVRYTADEMLEIMSELNLAICSRFHSHVFAIIAGCPFISLATTRKVELLLEDLQIKGQRSEELLEIASRNRKLLSTEQLNNLMWSKEIRPRKKLDIDKLYSDLRSRMISWGNVDPEYTHFKLDRNIAQDLAEEACFALTSAPGSKYLWGTVNNLESNPGKLREILQWIDGDIQKGRMKDFAKFDLSIYDQAGLDGFHRAGWPYVLNYLKSLNSPTGVIFDTFADRAFLWGSWILKRKGILPYTSLWVGIFHHCPNEEYTENNSWRIVRSPLFAQSLPNCRGIICLSEYLSEWYRERLKELGYSHIPVQTVLHPTLFVDRLWTPSKKIKLVNVGAWYRNPFTIYRLDLPEVEKFALKGPQMNSHFPPNPLDLNLKGNKWVDYLRKYSSEPDLKTIQRWIDSVTVLEKLSDSDYDILLAESVVFLDLVDVSAANTIIECIVRNTPLFVNRHPAVIEYLGEMYPLYYDNYEDIPNLLNLNRIEEAWTYLKSRDKSNLSITRFLELITSGPIYSKIYSDL